MKILIYALMALALGLAAFNATRLDFNALLEGDSGLALNLVLVGLSTFVLLLILLISKKIAAKKKF